MKKFSKMISVMMIVCFGLLIRFTTPYEAEAYSMPTVEEVDKACEPYWDYIIEASDKYNIAPEFIEAVIYRESSGNPKCKSKCNAQGLMQIIPKWAKSEMKECGVSDLYDPKGNIMVGSLLLCNLFEKYEDPITVLMCYNEGEYGTALDRAEECNFSSYSVQILEMSDALQAAHYDE